MANRLTTSAQLGTWHHNFHLQYSTLSEQLKAHLLSPADMHASLASLETLFSNMEFLIRQERQDQPESAPFWERYITIVYPPMQHLLFLAKEKITVKENQMLRRQLSFECSTSSIANDGRPSEMHVHDGTNPFLLLNEDTLKYSFSFIPLHDLYRAARTGIVFNQMCQLRTREVYREYLQNIQNTTNSLQDLPLPCGGSLSRDFTPSPNHTITLWHLSQVDNKLFNRVNRHLLTVTEYAQLKTHNKDLGQTLDKYGRYRSREYTHPLTPPPPPSRGKNFPHLPHSLVSQTLFTCLSLKELCYTAPTNRTWHTICNSSAQHTYHLLTLIAHQYEQKLRHSFPGLEVSPLLTLPSHMRKDLLTPKQLIDIQYIVRNNLLRNFLRCSQIPGFTAQNFHTNMNSCLRHIHTIPIFTRYTHLHLFLLYYTRRVFNDALPLVTLFHTKRLSYYHDLLNLATSNQSSWNELYSEMMLDDPKLTPLYPKFFKCIGHSARLQPEHTLLYLEKMRIQFPHVVGDIMNTLFLSHDLQCLIHFSPIRTWRLCEKIPICPILDSYSPIFMNNLGLFFIGLVNTGYPEMGLALLRDAKRNHPQALLHLVNHDQLTALKKAMQTAMEFDFKIASELDEDFMYFTAAIPNQALGLYALHGKPEWEDLILMTDILYIRDILNSADQGQMIKQLVPTPFERTALHGRLVAIARERKAIGQVSQGLLVQNLINKAIRLSILEELNIRSDSIADEFKDERE